MKVPELVNELYELIENSKMMPLSSSCIVNKESVLQILQEIEQELPREFSQAATLLQEREALVEDARNQADRIVALGRAEAAQLVSKEQVYREALAEAEALREATNTELMRMRRELDDYVDAKLAAFEAALTKTLSAVQAGRERTAVRLVSELAHPDEAEHPGAFFGDWENPRP